MHPDRAHPAGVQDDDPIGVGDRRQPVGNDQDGSVDGFLARVAGVWEDRLAGLTWIAVASALGAYIALRLA